MATAPLEGLRVVCHAQTVAAAYAARMLGVQGAEVVWLEPPQGSALRRAAASSNSIPGSAAPGSMRCWPKPTS